MASIDVFADITCPFTPVGLRVVADRLAARTPDVACRVRAWPLEWVNGEPLDPSAVATKVGALRSQLGTEYFGGFDPDRFPTTTIPALNLAASAYEVDDPTGLRVSLELRDAVFEEGLDVADPEVLRAVATRHGLAVPLAEPSGRVVADYEDGQRLGVRGSPDFFANGEEFFCPILDLSHDEDGLLQARFDIGGLEAFLAAATAAS